MTGYCGGSKEVFADGINDKKIWAKKCENGQPMYQTFQLVESYTEKSVTIGKTLQKYKSSKEKSV